MIHCKTCSSELATLFSQTGAQLEGSIQYRNVSAQSSIAGKEGPSHWVFNRHIYPNVRLICFPTIKDMVVCFYLGMNSSTSKHKSSLVYALGTHSMGWHHCRPFSAHTKCSKFLDIFLNVLPYWQYMGEYMCDFGAAGSALNAC